MKSTYDRLTTLDFLDTCPESIRAFYKYWDSKRQGRQMPSRADLDPIEMKEFLSSIILVDVKRQPLDFVYRLVGTKEVDARGFDPTGRSVSEGSFGATVEEVLTNYRIVSEHKCPVYDREGVPSDIANLWQGDAILLPLSDDDETVNMVVAYTDFIHIK
ncbi:PAS domain-containing protein [Kiloniella litopenaei]|uniref:PAS domain-containing protein n=1 Tax=Kiloniella litopenaei TaxID=1549748 RepID=UPI0012FECE97|nr:PAS domain-containing protein [Kiloniella litopenaei]